MPDENGPTLADDEITLTKYATGLADQFDAIVDEWFHQLVESRAPGLAQTQTAQIELEAGAAMASNELRSLLARDIADQPMGPLEILRRSVRFPTAVLAAAEAPPVPRDDFATTNFADDVYDLTPASFGDVHPSLHEPGLMWGAAKAHVHLRRRREVDG